MESVDHEVIIKKIERGHRAKENRPGRNLPIIAIFKDWNYSEEVETNSIEAAKDGNDCIPILFSQVYSPALNTRRNEAMKKQKELREEHQGIRAYVKYQVKLCLNCWLNNQVKQHTHHVQSIRSN